MTSAEIRHRFLDYFQQNDHLLISNHSLIPENDPTLLLINSGMAPLKPYFTGELKPPAKRLCNIQRCVRITDLEDVGNAHHLTFFEMLGSWSIGDYGKKKAVEFAFGLLTDPENGFGLDANRLYPTVFKGNKDIPQDKETALAWEEMGINKERILYLGDKENLWQSGLIGPCGPCTEVLYDRGKEFSCSPKCNPQCGCGRFLEIWNAGVFMEYDKQVDESYKKLPFLSVDTGAGLERLALVLQKKESVYDTDLFLPVFEEVKRIAEVGGVESQKHPAASALPQKSQNALEAIQRRLDLTTPEAIRSLRIITDHVRLAVFLIADGVMPSNTERGYISRRLIRRAVCHGLLLDIDGYFLIEPAEKIIEIMGKFYPHLLEKQDEILKTIEDEEKKFGKTLKRGIKELHKIIKSLKQKNKKTKKQGRPKSSVLCGTDAFKLYDTYGLPLELCQEICQVQGVKVDEKGFRQEMAKQKKRARKAGQKKQKAMAKLPQKVAKHHTATHLLNQALRKVLGDAVHQAGSDLTPERLRFDFTFDRALTKKELNKIEKLVNQKIGENLPVEYLEVTYDEAVQQGAEALFVDKYAKEQKLTMYKIGAFSKELCKGPHVKSTKELGSFRILKQEAVSSGVRRIRARCE